MDCFFFCTVFAEAEWHIGLFFFVLLDGTYIPSNRMYVPAYGIYIPSFGTENISMQI
jgi:hypothetical protein